MKMKDVMLNRGMIAPSAQEVTCPTCGYKSLYDPDNNKWTVPLFHEENCVYVSDCKKMGINPHDVEDERVKNFIFKYFEVRNLF